MPGEPPGYRPDLDRSDTGTKVGGILNDLHENKFIYISNGSMGDSLTAAVVTKCHETGLFDQYSIAQFIFQLLTPDHAEYWRKIGDGVVHKRDIRDRCWCGKLAQQSGKHGPVCSSKHDVDFRGRVKTVRRQTRAGQADLFGEEESSEVQESSSGLDELLAVSPPATGKRRARRGE